MADKVFDRVFRSRRRGVQYQTIAQHEGYEVVRWDVADAGPTKVGFFGCADFGGSWANCREAATDYAQACARGEQR